MRITQYFNEKNESLSLNQRVVDFVDVDTDIDTPLFLDSQFLYSKMDSKWASETYAIINDFIEFIKYYIEKEDFDTVKDYCQHFKEPKGFGLGRAKTKSNGSGISPKKALAILQELHRISRGLNKDIMAFLLADVKVFMENVGSDNISDLIATIIRKQLIDYTAEQCDLYEIPLQTGVFSDYYWNTEISGWDCSLEHRMLVIGGQPRVLVPKSMVYLEKIYRFNSESYSFPVVDFLVEEEYSNLNSKIARFETMKNGEVRKKVYKKDIRENFPVTKKDYLYDFSIRNPKIYEQFRENVNTISIPNEDINNITTHDLPDCVFDEFVDYLITEYSLIEAGNSSADKFHNHTLSVINFLFYPALNRAVKEAQQHEGRKRVDIRYDTVGEGSKFFSQLKNDIPAMYTYVECKNYSVDVKNPELDQLSGRFGLTKGKFGILVFRDVENYDVLIQRCRDTFQDDRGLIIPLRDIDFIMMLNKSKKSNSTLSVTDECLSKIKDLICD